MNEADRPEWQLPRGITRGLWEYTQCPHIANDYDDYFACNRLFDFDEQVLVSHGRRVFKAGAVAADLGCGTGRALIRIVHEGYQGLAIDLSGHMLQIVKEKAELDDLSIQCVQANLVELDCLEDNCVRLAVCLFSTLGMIRGNRNRQRVLEHVRRILEPGGVFVLHVHNYWYNLFDPGGPWWIVKNAFRSLCSSEVEAGDKYFSYRGVPGMFLHVFRRGEVKRALRRAGFRVRQTILLGPQRHGPLRWPWWLGRLRANGWIMACD